MSKKIVVTGSSGLIGSEVCTHFDQLGWHVYGLDNNQRAVFFGPNGDTRWNQKRLEALLTHFTHVEMDIRDRQQIIDLISEIKPDAIVYAAAQPSHDKAAQIPFEDFDTNAVGTFNLLEATRRVCTDIPFVYLSTNKVYEYSDENRVGDHICYYSDLRKMKSHYPDWDITKSLEQTFREMYDSFSNRS